MRRKLVVAIWIFALALSLGAVVTARRSRPTSSLAEPSRAAETSQYDRLLERREALRLELRCLEEERDRGTLLEGREAPSPNTAGETPSLEDLDPNARMVVLLLSSRGLDGRTDLVEMNRANGIEKNAEFLAGELGIR